MQRNLQHTINQLYDVFQHYPLRSSMAMCTHCHSQDDLMLLSSKSLRELTENDLNHFSFSAMTTWGNVDDFRHFLPRIYELKVTNPDWWIDVEQIFGKLHYGNWVAWPRQEQEAVREFLHAFWHHTLDQVPLEWWADRNYGALCAIGQSEDDLSAYLAAWQTDPSDTALLRLAQLVDANAEAMVEQGVLSNAYWGDRQEQMKQVYDWLLKPDIGSILERAFSLYLSHKYRGEPALQFDRLRSLRC